MSQEGFVYEYDRKLVRLISLFNRANCPFQPSDEGWMAKCAGLGVQLELVENSRGVVKLHSRLKLPKDIPCEFARHVRIFLSGQPHNGMGYNIEGFALMEYVHHRIDYVKLEHLPQRPLR